MSTWNVVAKTDILILFNFNYFKFKIIGQSLMALMLSWHLGLLLGRALKPERSQGLPSVVN